MTFQALQAPNKNVKCFDTLRDVGKIINAKDWGFHADFICNVSRSSVETISIKAFICHC